MNDNFITVRKKDKKIRTMDEKTKNEIKECVTATLLSQDFCMLLTQTYIQPALKELAGTFSLSITEQETQIEDLKERLTISEEKVNTLSEQIDAQEQYSRRNSILIYGIPETQNNMETTIQFLANKMKIPYSIQDIDRIHRLGKKTIDATRPRPIICKFTSYRARALFIHKRAILRKLHTPVYINENLTQKRATLFKAARKCVVSKNASKSWTRDGNIFLVTNDEQLIQIKEFNDIPIGTANPDSDFIPILDENLANNTIAEFVPALLTSSEVIPTNVNSSDEENLDESTKLVIINH